MNDAPAPLALHPAMVAAIAEEVTRQTAPLFTALADLAASNGRFALAQLAFNGALIDRVAEAEARLAEASRRIERLERRGGPPDVSRSVGLRI